MDKTVDRIVKASGLPLSIVIVGVGGADFSAMVRIWQTKLVIPDTYCEIIQLFSDYLNALNK